ncbi:MAG: bla regulator protein blaR1 [Phycisphaerales bacterium]|nr:bla regulator protein blaR1 [Phycisphaerales bacterium]
MPRRERSVVQMLVSILIGNAVVATVLAIAALVAMKLHRPAAAHVLWLLVIVKLLTPPMWRVAVTDEAAAPQPPQQSIAVIAPAPRVITASPHVVSPATPAHVAPQPPSVVAPSVTPQRKNVCIPCILGWIWLGGSAAWLTLAAVRIARFRRLLRQSAPADDELRSEIAALAARFGLSRIPDCRIVDAAVSPMLWFLGRRVKLILPKKLVTTMPRSQREGVIAHELAHLKRRDHWVRLLEIFATAILWFHPLLWLARRGLREAEEQCCDAWVVALLPDARRRYADALVDALEMIAAAPGSLALPAGATGLGQIEPLRRRLTMILSMTPPKSLSWVGRIAVVAIAMVVVPLLPVRGQAQQAGPAGGESGTAPAPASSSTTTTPATGHDDATRQAVEALLDRAVQDPNQQVRDSALNAVSRFGPRAIPALLDGVKNERTAEAARNLLARFGLDSVDPLLEALKSPEAQVRREALSALTLVVRGAYTTQNLNARGPQFAGAYDGGYRGAVPGGEAMMEDPAFGGAAWMGMPMPEPVVRMIPLVIKAASDSDVGVRRAAVQLISHLAIVAARTNEVDKLLPSVIAAMKDPDADVRGDAIWATSQIGPAAAATTPALIAALKDENQRVRYTALLGLRAIGPQARDATPAVIAALKDPDPNARAAAAEALGALQTPAPPAPVMPGAAAPMPTTPAAGEPAGQPIPAGRGVTGR